MSCNRLEPIPIKYRKPGDIVYTPGYSESIQIISYPVCRLYIDETVPIEQNGLEVNGYKKFRFQPNMMEYRKGNQGNYLSYLATMGKSEFYVTDQLLKPELLDPFVKWMIYSFYLKQLTRLLTFAIFYLHERRK